MKLNEEIYLGDAVYASFDGYQIRLRTGDGNNQVIYLEPEVVQRFESYLAFIRMEIEALNNKEKINET